MPELPEIETIIRGLQQKIVGQKVVGAKVILPKIIRQEVNKFTAQVEGTQIQGIRRRGKLIIIDLSHNMSLVVHLKLTGQIIYTSPDTPVANHTHLIFDLSGGNQLRYIDLRQFGYLLLAKTSTLFEFWPLVTLGPEPMDISLSDFKKLMFARKGRIKSLLLNQSFLSGIGNIYADEVLHRAHIHPLQPSQLLTVSRIELLYQTIQEVLTEAIKYQGSSVRDYVDSNGQKGNYQKLHRVYQRQGQSCLTCQKKIARLKIGGRSSYFCPHCQKMK